MPHYYPIFINLKDKPCLVVGGGEVARRKVETLLTYGARVRVVSPQVGTGILRLAARRQIELLRRGYEAQDVAGCCLVIGATDDPEVNRRVAEDASRAGVLVNIVDEPDLCSFIVPSVVRRGELQVAVSTGGCSPALAKRLRIELSAQFGPEYAEYVELLGRCREEVLRRVEDEEVRRGIFQRLVEGDVLELIRQGDKAGLRGCLREILGFEPPV